MLPDDVALEHGGLVVDAARASLVAGGKRLRPILLMHAAEICGGTSAAIMALPFAVALEYIHTYSLIHDDLPAMDDAPLRRGKPTCHITYGEGIAVLAGDMLLNSAYELLFKALDITDPRVECQIACARRIARGAGVYGMIGGQTLDLSSEGCNLSAEELEVLQARKTGGLIDAAIVGGALLGAAEKTVIPLFERFANRLGLAFQIRDDLLDVTANEELLGKCTHQDDRSRKATFVTTLGQEEAEQRLDRVIMEALDTLDHLASKE